MKKILLFFLVVLFSWPAMADVVERDTTPISDLKNWFSRGKKPTQEQFHQWIESFRHLDDPLDIEDTAGLIDSLASIRSVAEAGGTPGVSDSLTALRTDVNNIQTLSGMPDGATDLGTFTGDKIPNSSSVKAALQALESAFTNLSISPVTGRAWNDTLCCDNSSGVFYVQQTMTDTFKVVGDETNSVSGCDGVVRVVADGSNPVILSGLDFTYGITSGSILAAGTYEFVYRSTPDGLSLEVPNAALVAIISNPEQNADSILVRAADSVLVAISPRYDDLITVDGNNRVVELKMPSSSPIYSIRQDTASLRPEWDDTANRFQFRNIEAFRQDSVATEVGSFDDDYSLIVVADRDTNGVFNQLVYMEGDYNSESNSSVAWKGNGLLANVLQFQNRTLNIIAKETGATNDPDTTKHIIALSYDGSAKELTLFYDGTFAFVDEDVDPGAAADFTKWTIARRQSGPTTFYNSSNFDGDLYELFVYDTKLDSAKIRTYANHLNGIHNIYLGMFSHPAFYDILRMAAMKPLDFVVYNEGWDGYLEKDESLTIGVKLKSAPTSDVYVVPQDPFYKTGFSSDTLAFNASNYDEYQELRIDYVFDGKKGAERVDIPFMVVGTNNTVDNFTFNAVNPWGHPTIPTRPKLTDAPFIENLASYRHINSLADAEAARESVIDWVWSGDGLPTGTCDEVVTDWEGWGNFDASGLNGFASQNRYRVNTDSCQDYGYMAVPTAPNGKLVWCVYGHGTDWDINNMPEQIEGFLEAGYHVACKHLPLNGINSCSYSALDSLGVDGHNQFRLIVSDSLNPIKFFLEPYQRMTNQILQDYPSLSDSIYFCGISGGAWATVWTSAIDERIVKSVAVAGNLPRVMNQYSNEPGASDWEQGLDWGESIIKDFLVDNYSYIDLYLMASRNGRQHFHLRNIDDSCCFSGYEWQGWKDTVAGWSKGIVKGKFDVIGYREPLHQFPSDKTYLVRLFD